jgi:hypothetical protein
MPRIYVEFAKLKSNGNKCKSIADKVDDIRDDFQRTINQLDWDIKFEADIDNTAKKIIQKLDRYEQALKKYQSFIDEAYDKYLDLDELGFDKDISNSNSSEKSSFWDIIKDSFNDSWHDTFPILSLLSDSLFGLGGYSGNLFGNVVKLAKNATSAWGQYFDLDFSDRFLGLNVKQVPLASWTDRFSASFNNSLRSSVKSVFTWVGAGFSLISNAYENFTQEENTTTRSTFETITETIIDVGKGILIGAGAAAAVAAIGLSGPVGWIAVAGLTIGGSVALDAGASAVTSKSGESKDFTEAISDWYLDTSEKKINETSDLFRNAVNCYNQPAVMGGGSSW